MQRKGYFLLLMATFLLSLLIVNTSFARQKLKQTLLTCENENIPKDTTLPSIYGTIGQEYQDANIVKYARHTYEFYVGDPSTDRSAWPKIDEIIVRDGDTLTLPPTPAGDSKHPFAGWYSEDANGQLQTEVTGGVIAIASETSSDSVIKVYATFNRLYSLELYTDETTGTIYKTYIAEDGTIVALPASDDEDFDLPMHDGYDFVGWKEAGTSDENIVLTVTINGEDIQLVPVIATSKTVKFVVDYEGLGVTDEEIDDQHVFAGGTAVAPSNFTEGEIYSGFLFDGWYENPTRDETTGEYIYTYKWDFNTLITDDVMLYAKWTPVPVTFTVEIWQEKQNVVGEYGKKYTSTESEEQNYGFVGEPGTSIVGMIDNILQYESDKRDKHFHLSGMGATDVATDPYAIEVWQDGVLVAEYDANAGSWISGSEDAVIKGGDKTVVRVYESRNTYRLHFLFRDGGSGYECYNTCGYTTVRTDHQDYLPEGLPTTGTLSGQVYTLRFKDNLYRTVYLNEVNPDNAAVDNTVIQKLMDAGWYFYTQYCRSEGGQTVFNATNKGYNLNPRSDMTDGMDVVCLIYYNTTMTPHPFVYQYYTPDNSSFTSVERTILYSVTFNNNNQPTNPHTHNFQLNNTEEGYRLVKITTPLEYTIPNYVNGKESYTFTYDGRSANPMVLHFEPIPYHITFEPNDGNILFTSSNGAWPTVDDQTAFYVGDSYSSVVNEVDGPGAARYQTGYTEMQNGVLKRFDGWFDNEALEGDPVDFTSELTMPNRNLTFYGKWTPVECTVVFHPNNGNDNTEVQVIIGNKVLRIPNPERDDYIFGGWYTDAEFTNPYDFNTNLTPEAINSLADAEGKVHIYAEWNSHDPYRILYDENGGSLTGTLLEKLDATHKDTVPYRGNSMAEIKGVAEKEGYVFVGWRIGQRDIVLTDGTPLLVDAAHDAEDGTEDQVITLVAQYEKATRNTTLIYHSNYPEGTTDVEHVVNDLVVNSNYTLLDVTDVNFMPTSGKWQFVGWTTSSDASIYTGAGNPSLFYPGETVAPGVSDNDLYAVWLPLLQLHFSKVWNTTDGTTPEGASVTIQLHANGTAVSGKAITLSGTVWEGLFEDLPQYDENGVIEYSVQETALTTTDGNIYLTRIDGNLTDGITVTNTPTPDIVKTVNGGEHAYLGSWDEEFAYEITSTIPVMDGLNSFVITDVLDDKLTFASTPEVSIGGSNVHYCTEISGQTLTVTVPATHLADHQGETVSITFEAKFKENVTYADLAGYVANAVPNEASYKINNTIDSLSNRVYVTPAVLVFKGEKSWEDNDNRAGKRPEAIIVNIMNGNSVVESITCTPDASGKWEYTSQELPVLNADGDTIQYTVTETAVDEYEAPIYSAPLANADGSEITVNITNIYVEEPVSVSGTKTWDDEENIDGSRPSSIIVNLYADGVLVNSTTVTADATGNWSYSFTGLQRYRDNQTAGELIVYTVEEVAVAGYETSISDYDITNSYTPERVSVPFHKIWNDNSDQDGRRPKTVTFGLFKGNDTEPVATQVVNAAENHHDGIFDNLLKKENGEEVSYSVKELDPTTNSWITSGTFGGVYTSTMTMVDDTFAFTNAYTPEVVTVTANKTWDDDNNVAGIRPATLTLILEQDGAQYGQPISINADNSWTYTWHDLPKYHDGGILYNYSVIENAVENYTANDPLETQTNNSIVFDFTNNHSPGKTSISVTKDWEDGHNQDGLRPESVQVQLLRKAENATGWENVGEAVTLSTATNWMHTFSELDIYVSGQQGVHYDYSVKEVGENNGQYAVGNNGRFYTVEYIEEGNFVIRNSMTPEVTEVAVKKFWSDEENRDGKRPASVEVQLFADGSLCRDAVILNAANNWTYTFTELPKYDHSTTPIDYTVKEHKMTADGLVQTILADYGDEVIAGLYTVAYSAIAGTEADTLTVTNTHTPETMTVQVNKDWEDGNDHAGLRPASVSVTLKADDETVGTVTLNEENGWEHEWSNLAVFRANAVGDSIVYSMTETPVDDYTSQITSTGLVDGVNSFTVTNTHELEYVSVSVTKVWDDQNDVDGVRPANIAMQLYRVTTDATAQEIRTAVGSTVVLNTDDNWTYTWTQLDKVLDGEEVVYVVDEVNIPEGYTKEITGNMSEGFTVTNSYTPEVMTVSVSKEWDDADNQDGKRPATLTYTLLQDGESYGEPVTVDADDSWSHTWNGLPKHHDKGTPYHYTVIESDVTDYTIGEVEMNTTDNTIDYTFVNMHIPSTVDIPVLKVWNTIDNAIPEGASVTLQLFADGTAVPDAVITLSGTVWDSVFKELPEYNDGEAITYTVQEVAMTTADGNLYLSKTDGNMTEGFTFTNTAAPDVVKTINGGSHTYLGSWNEAFTYELSTAIPVMDGLNSFVISDVLDDNLTFASSPAVTIGGDPVTCAAVNGQTLTVTVPATHLAEHQGETVTITFEAKFKEGVTYADLSDYDANAVPNEASYSINNTIDSVSNRVHVTPAVITFKGEKSWIDNYNRAGLRPEAIVVNIMNDNSVVESITCTPDASGKWEYTSQELPVLNADGDTIQYTVTETAVDEYEAPIYSAPLANADGSEITVNITNIYVEEPVSVSGTKIWNDYDNTEGYRPNEITVNLFADGEFVNSATVTADTTGNWSYSFSGLQRYRDGQTTGQPILYTVDEEDVVGYEKSINGFNIINSRVPDSIDLFVEKFWEDQSNNDGFRPESITVMLYAGSYPTITLSEANSWKGTFGRWPKFENGEEIGYVVAEEEVDKYNQLVESGYNNDSTAYNFAITNKHVPETVNLTVYKHWDDNNNADGLRTPVTVQLYSTLDGTLTFEDDSDNEGWTLRGEKLIESITDYASATWENMPKYYHGTLIRYAVCEKVTPTDYVRSYSNGNELTAANGYIDTITNLHKSPVEVTLEAAKKITNRAWFETDTFAMALFAHPKTNPMPEISGVNNGTPFSEVRITSIDSVVSDSVRFDTFSPILFTLDDLEDKTDSVFHYTIREMPPATTGLSVIPGITYSAKRFDVEIRLSRDNHDSLQYAVTYWATTTVDGEEVRDSVVQYPVFINQYDEQSSLYHPSANKSLAFMGNHSLKNREFQFEMRPAGQHAAIAPMPENTVGTDINRVLKVYNTGNEVRFFENNDDGLHFTYLYLKEHFTNEELYAGVNFSYEMREVIPDDAVNHNDGTMSKKVGDVETFYDAVVHYRQLHVKIEDAPGEVIMLVVTPVENTVLQEFYLKDNGDTVLVERGTLASELRHTSTAPIFRNVRIVDTTVTVKKSWVDYNNTLSLRPDSVIVKLLADGDSINYAVLKADNDWEHSFSGLPTAKLNDTLGLDTIHYSIAEVEVSNYYSAVQRHTSNIYHFSVTNTLDSNIVKKDTSILVQKTWIAPQGTVHPSIKIILLRDGEEIDSVTLANGVTEHTFANLPYYNVFVNGKVVVTNSPLLTFSYHIEEQNVGGYSTTIDGGNITNTIHQELLNIAGTKTWVAPAGIALPDATIVLTRDGVKLDSVILTSGATSYSFANLPKYDVITNNAVIDQGDGHLFEYAVLERPVEGYASVQNGNNFTNTINQEWIEIPVSKVWDDLSNNDGFRPDSVTLQLTGTTAASTVHYTLDVVGTGDQWDTTFKELPKYDDARNIYTYTLSEPTTPQEYEQSVTGYTVTNSYTPDSMNLTVYKFWDDNDNNDGLREPVKVVLYQTTDETLVFDPDSDNEGWTVVGDTVTIPVCSETTNPRGCYVVWPVPVYNAGKEIRYAVKEVTTIDNYVITYESGGLIIRANDNVEVITNRHKSPVNVALEVQKKIRGRAWFETDTFAMALNPTNNENPMPTDATLISGIPYSMIKVFSTQTAVNDSVRQNSFGDITFTMDDLEGKSDSTFIYRIFELAPAASGLTDIPGMTYSGTVYQVEVTISEVASKSSLQSSIAYYVIHSDESKTPADLTLFTNIYNDSLVTYKLNAYKSLVAYDAPALSDDEFSFTLKPVGENAAIAPMPDGTVGMGANRSLTVRNEGVNVEFFDDDISGDGLRFDYEELRALGFSDEDLTDGIRFEYEMREDNIPANAVFNSGNYTYSLNADGITTYYDAVVHHRTILVKMKEVNDKVVLAADAEQSVHRDYYLNGSDTTWLTSSNDIRYTKRHGYGGVPIFCNFRIADTAVTVTKEWIDGENVEELRPEFVTITLMADGENTGLTPTLNTDNNWSYRFTGLPTAVLNNTLGFDTIVYTVEETQVDHYLAPEYSGNMRDGLVVTNTLEPIFIDIPVTKIWEDDRNNDGFRPDSVTLTLEGTTANDTVTFTRKMGGIVEAENWTDDQWDTVFTGLPKYDAALNQYEYSLTEEAVDYYTTGITGDAEEGFTVTNTHADSMITFIIRKVWVDNDDQDGIRPNTVYGSVSSQYGDDFFFALYDDMDFIQESHPMHKYYKRNLNTIVLTEFPVPDGYEVSYSGSAETGEFVITNTHVPDSVRITVDKIWDDHFNNDGIRPNSISVNLLANGDSVATRTITGTGHEWEADFGKWPVKSDGDSIEYSLSETWVPGYQAPSNVQLITETEGVYKLRITNVHKLDSIDLTVVKVWNDFEVTDGRSDVQLQLFRCYDNTVFDPVHVSITGDAHWVPVGTIKTLSTETDTIPVTWNRLPQFYQGAEVRYAVKEIGSPAHYTTTYVFGGELTEGHNYTDTIVNTRIEASTTSVLAVQKKLTGREWFDSDIFEMALIPERSTQPMPNTVGNVNGIVYAPLFITNDSTSVNDSVRLGTFEPITFNLTDLGGASSKTFLYHIRELTATESGLDRIIGVTYGSERYEVDVTVEFANNTLAVTDVAVYPIHHNTVDNVISEYRGDRLAGNPTITNRYNDSVTIYRLVADKQLTIVGLEDTLQSGDYHFMLKPVGDNAALAPMPENTTGTGVNRTLTVSNEGNAVRFYDDDTEEDGLRFDYEELIAAGFTDDQLLEGIGFEYEVHEVIPTDVTYVGNGFWSRTVTNSEGIMEDEIYDGLIHYRNIVVKMQEIDGKVVLNLTSGNNDRLDYYLDAEGNQHYLSHDDATFAQRHGTGGVPIFRNGRIARLNIAVEKVWDDYDNALDTRPESITVTLLANGVATDNVATLNEDNGWAYTFENLQASQPATGIIEYSVVEGDVAHYTATYSGDMTEGFFILNTLVDYGEDDDCTISVERSQLSSCPAIDCSPVTDAAGITYQTVKVDGYCWMAENLRTPTANAMVYQSVISPNTDANLATYGYLYTWHDAAGGTDTPERIDGYVRGICPNGWHLPTEQEINVLMTNSADALRSDSLWVNTVEGANSTGFNALPAGQYVAAIQRFEGLRSTTLFHGDTPNSVFSLEYFCCKVVPNQQSLLNGYSVRCVKDCE